MKNLNRTFLSYISALVFSFLLTNCNKEKTNSNLNIDNSDAKEIAFHHNQALNYMYSKDASVLERGGEEFNSDILNMFKTYAVEANYCSEEEGADAVKKVLPIFNDLFPSQELRNSASLEYKSKLMGNLNELAEDQELSETFVNDVLHLMDYEAYDNDLDYLNDYVTNTMASRNFSGKDLVYFSLFKEMVKASSEFWIEYYKSHNYRLEPGSWVIINDTIGAIFGSPFGGIGSALLGGALSLATNEGW